MAAPSHSNGTAIDLLGVALELGDQFAKEVRLFGLGSLFCQRYLRLRTQIYQEKLKILTTRTISYFFAQAIAGLFIFAIFAFIVNQTIHGLLRLGDLVLYFQALQRGQTNLKGLLTHLSGLYEDNLFLANLYEFLELKPQIIAPRRPRPHPPPHANGLGVGAGELPVWNHKPGKHSRMLT